MAPKQPRLKVLSVGGNSVSAFLSWRLQATNACDVTLVWKSGFEHVSQYGISFKSQVFGNERFKPRHVVRSPEEAAQRKDGVYDYVVLCVKALPDIYDLASVIDPVVTPQHTCILVNTTHSLGLEAAIEERFPTNVVLSLVCGAELSQLGQSEFEHKGSIDMWVGPANKNDNIPQSIQDDMAQALAITLSGGQVDCKVSANIRQHQLERLIGPIAFHTTSVIFETPDYTELLNKIGVQQIISDVIDEMLTIATAQGCKFPEEFKQTTIDEMKKKSGTESIMWQDFQARRPMEVETYLGSPVRLAKEAKVAVPRIETLYAILHNVNVLNRQRPRGDPMAGGYPPAPGSPTLTAIPSPNPRMSQAPGMRMPSNNMMPRQRPRGTSQIGPPGGMGRRPPQAGGMPPNGYGRASMGGPMPGPNGYPSRLQSRRGSMEGGDLEEFSHVLAYDEAAEGGQQQQYGGAGDIALREREIALRRQEMDLREREMAMRRGYGPPGPGPGAGPGPRRGGPPPPRRNQGAAYDDEDEDEDYFDPSAAPAGPPIDPDNFDMMSVTSRRARNGRPSASQLRKNPEFDNQPNPNRSSRFRPNFGRNRTSQMIDSAPNVHDNILNDPLMGFTSNRYGTVDRGAMNQESRTNSLTAQRLEELNHNTGGPGGPPPPGPVNPAYMNMRRASQSPGNPFNPQMRGGNGRPSPPNGMHMNGPPMNGRPSPPNGMRQPIPRHPPGHGNVVAPQQVEQHVGVSSLQPPPKNKSSRSLTGSASASAGSGDSNHFDSGPSAHSSSSSLGPRPPIGVR